MLPKLLVDIEVGQQLAIELPREGAILGRETSLPLLRPLCSTDFKISTRHCRLSQRKSGWLIEDLRSTNGTFVNDERVERKELAHLEIIRIGGLALRFFSPPAQPQGGATPPEPSTGELAIEPPPDTSALVQAEAEVARLREELHQSGLSCLALEAERRTLRQEREREAADRSVLKQQLHDLEARLAREQQIATSLRDAILQLRRECDQAHAERESLRGQVVSLEADRREAQAVAQRLPVLLERCERAEAERQRLLTSCSEARSEANELRSVVSESERMIKDLRDNAQLHHSQLADLHAELDRRNKQLTQQREAGEELNRRLVNMQKNLERDAAQSRELQAENRRLSMLCNLKK